MKKKKKQKYTRTKHEFDSASIVDTKDFAAQIVEGAHGRNELKISSPVWYQHQLNKFRPKERVSLYISSRRPKRTVQQNRYYWHFLEVIGKETGEHDTERLHSLFSGKFLTTGIVEVLGEKVRMKRSTTELSKSDFSEYIMNIEAETGIVAPPTQNYFDPAPDPE